MSESSDRIGRASPKSRTQTASVLFVIASQSLPFLKISRSCQSSLALAAISATMDYSSYFAASQQPFHLMGLPPTPSHTHSGASDDFSNGSPSVSLLPADYVSSPHLLTSPSQLDAFEQFQDFDGFPHFATGIVKPPTPTPSAHQPIDVQPAAQLSQRKSSEQTNIDANSDQQQGGSNSDNEDMTPAQSKRKAQNRAA